MEKQKDKEEEFSSEKYMQELEEAYVKEKERELEKYKDPFTRNVRMKEIELEISQMESGINECKMELDTLKKIK